MVQTIYVIDVRRCWNNFLTNGFDTSPFLYDSSGIQKDLGFSAAYAYLHSISFCKLPCTCRIPITCYWVVFIQGCLFDGLWLAWNSSPVSYCQHKRVTKAQPLTNTKKWSIGFFRKNHYLVLSIMASRRWKPWRRWRWVRLPKARVGCQWCQLENRMARFSVSRNEGIPPIGFEGKHGNEYCSSN